MALTKAQKTAVHNDALANEAVFKSYRKIAWSKWPASAKSALVQWAADEKQLTAPTAPNLFNNWYLAGIKYDFWPPIVQQNWNYWLGKKVALDQSASKSGNIVSKAADVIKMAVSPYYAVAKVSPTMAKIIDPLGSTGLGQKMADVTAKTVAYNTPGALLNEAKGEPLKRVLATIGDAAVNPLSKSGYTVNVLGYNIAGQRAAKKTVAGGVSGFITGGPYGALAGAAAANLQKGKPQTVTDVAIGLASGYVASNAGTLADQAKNLAAGEAKKYVGSLATAAAAKAVKGKPKTAVPKLAAKPATISQKTASGGSAGTSGKGFFALFIDWLNETFPAAPQTTHF